MSTNTIENAKIVSRDEWLAARKELLDKEKQTAPLSNIEEFEKRMGWRFAWVSTFGTAPQSRTTYLRGRFLMMHDAAAVSSILGCRGSNQDFLGRSGWRLPFSPATAFRSSSKAAS
jgi:hypothetical protein